MKLPTKVFSHCLAHEVAITPPKLRQMLIADQKLGYSGMVILPLLTKLWYSPNDITQPFQDTGMQGLVCGLIPGNGPSPFDQPRLVLKSLRRQARFAAMLADKNLGSAGLVGPLHTHHRQPLPANWTESMFYQWIDTVDAVLQEFGLRALYEPLNAVEDKTPQPFQTLHKAVMDRASGLQYDTGHANAHGVTMEEFQDLAPKIGYFEFANVGRWPLDESKGIDFGAYAQAMADLPDDCLVGAETFCQAVITTFGLKGLCDTDVSGEETLRRDAKYLQEKLGVIAKTA